MGIDQETYRERVLPHYLSPSNYGTLDEPSFSHTRRVATCGDELTVDVELTQTAAGPVVETIRFHGEGCALSQAAMSRFSEVALGTPLSELCSYGPNDLRSHLGYEVPPNRLDCAMLGPRTLQDGARIYRRESAPGCD